MGKTYQANNMKQNEQTAEAIEYSRSIIESELHEALEELMPAISTSILENLVLRLSGDEAKTVHIEVDIPPRKEVVSALESRYEGIREGLENGQKAPFAGGAKIRIL